MMRGNGRCYYKQKKISSYRGSKNNMALQFKRATVANLLQRYRKVEYRALSFFTFGPHLSPVCMYNTLAQV